MAQHDYVIDNSTGANVRADINNALLAISSNNSGSSAPSTNYASQFFANTSSSIMQLRNTANNAHINLFSLAGAPAFPLDGTINGLNIGRGSGSRTGNTVFGESALDASTTTDGIRNTAVGFMTLSSLTSAQDNAAFGYQALVNLQTGSGNTAFGGSTLTACVSGANNTAMGRAALEANTGDNNTAMGYFALIANQGGSANTSLGWRSMEANQSGSNNVAVGFRALDSNTTGSDSVAIGDQALAANQTNGFKVAIGANAATLDTAAGATVAIGNNCLKTNATGVNNTGVGAQCFMLTTASNNTGLGLNAGRNTAAGGGNTFVGASAGITNTSGDSNTACGAGALNSNDTGAGNTAVGLNAGYNLTTGSINTFLGISAGTANSPGGQITTTSNNFVLGDNNVTNLLCADTSISASDSRDKADITDFTQGLSWINSLRPVTFRWDRRTWYGTDEKPYGTSDGSKKKAKINVGFLAQEVLEVEKANGYGADNDNSLITFLQEDEMAYMLKEGKFIPILVNAIKELSAKVTALESG